MGMKFKV